ncbi:hypothetical protein ZIOFF_041144 [Zingiber officinale]|uniref:non-specific serine/threonine protein kinase n=1 Tax=Zingiber officinale TaxID=94328 RepID=A0A8J5L5B4_ZINOF|nr:hypothetical protein ZIOFF_041144 [Zingiber officinale]
MSTDQAQSDPSLLETMTKLDLIRLHIKPKVVLVRLCREKSSYSMKKLRKSEMVSGGEVGHVRAERNLFAEVASYYIVNLYCSFQGDEYLYLIKEYLPGGDMMTLLIIEDTLLKLLLDFGLCKLIDCSKLSILKEDEPMPDENIRESRDIDGFSDKHNDNIWKSPQEAFSMVGTRDYVAPEVLLKKGYGMECDCFPPYARHKTEYCAYWRNQLKFPKDSILSPEAKDLICRLLCDVEHRPGSGGADQIKAHPWFKEVAWDKLYEMYAAFKPEVNGELDIQNFLKYDEVVFLSVLHYLVLLVRSD